jgi:hypothetical protein
MNLRDITTKLKDALTSAKQIPAAAKAIEDEWTARRKERSRIFNGNTSQEETIQNVAAVIGAHRDQWVAAHGGRIVRDFSGHLETRYSNIADTVGRSSEVRPRLPRIFEGRKGNAAPILTFEDMCGLLPDAMIQRFQEIVRTSGETFGPPSAERPAVVATLDKEIADLEGRHSELVDAAAEVGIAIDLLPTVKARRDEDAKQRAREEELARQRVAAG